MKIKVSEATNLQLDWMVAKALGFIKIAVWPTEICVCKTHSFEDATVWSPTTYWAQGGPIIEREGLELSVHVIHNGVITSWASEKDWPNTPEKSACGPTPLIAAMRCFCVSKLGEEVEVPEELQ